MHAQNYNTFVNLTNLHLEDKRYSNVTEQELSIIDRWMNLDGYHYGAYQEIVEKRADRKTLNTINE